MVRRICGIDTEKDGGKNLLSFSIIKGLRTGCKQWGYPAIHKTKCCNTILTLSTIILAGDVEVNPGPVKYPCGICGRPVANNHRALECDTCNLWHHIKCAGITPAEYNQFVKAEEQGKTYPWECFTCGLPSLSDSFFTTEPHDGSRGRAASDCSTDSVPEDPSNSKQLKILLLNCRGIKSMKKRADLHGLLQTEKPDILFATESHLEKNIYDAEIFPADSGYKVTRKDRNKHGGGVLIAYKEHLIVTQMPDLGKDNESIYVKVQLQHAQTLHLGCFYRPTDCRVDALNALHRDLHSLLDKDRSPNLILGGDFNVPSCEWENLCHSPSPNYGASVNDLVLDLSRELGLTQMVESPTREQSLLGLLFCTNPDMSSRPDIVPGISDHMAVSLIVRVRPLAIRHKPRTVYLFKKENTEQMEKDMECLKTQYLQDCNTRSAEENWSFIKKGVLDSINKNVPTRKIVPGKDLPWLTRHIRKHIQKKRRLFNLAKQNREEYWEKFLEKERQVKEEIRESYLKYISGLMSDADEGQKRVPKKIWSFLKSRKKEASSVPALQTREGALVTDSQTKAEMLSSQYKSVFTVEDLTSFSTMGEHPHRGAEKLQISLKGVEKQLERLNIRKAVGPDLVPTRTLKCYRHHIAPILRHLFQQSVDKSSVPSDWKTANICAVFKKGDKTLCKNYRPVSLTSVTCKMLEHIIASHVMRHLDENEILNKEQHGFRRGHSCESQLINTIEEIARNVDQGSQTDIIILDFEKAFDTVAHNRLLQKLEYYGIRGNLHGWIKDWLIGRTQSVVLDGARSKEESVTSGVPQGTVLGPIMFLIYINNITDRTTSPMKLFADDGLLFRKVNTVEDAQALQKDLDIVTSWAHAWQMRFNPIKCYVLRISRKRNNITPQYEMMGTILQEVEHHPYLGIELDNKLSWNNQIDQCTAKAHKTLNFLRRNLYSCPSEVKEMAYKTLVRPLIEYGASAWDPGQVGKIRKVEKVQRKAARFVLGQWRQTSSVTEMVERLKWQSLQERRLVRRLTLLYQAHHHLFAIAIPSYVNLSIRPSSRKHPMQYLAIPSRTTVYADSFWPRTIQSWNDLPEATVLKTTVEAFKNALNQDLSAGRLQVADTRSSRILSPAARHDLGSSTVFLF
jgi:hypothetical protein